jgi:hypothetical protein
MKATLNGTSTVYWVVTGTPDYTGAYSGYNPANLTGIVVDYTSSLPATTVGGVALFSAGGDLIGDASSQYIVNLTGSGGFITVPTSSFKFGSIPATTGVIRLSTLGGIYARNNSNSGNLNYVSADSSDVITYGGTVNSGIKIGTSTGNTIQLQFNGTTSQIFGNGYLSFASNPAVAGTIRTPNSSSITSRNNANSADLNIASTNSSDNITYGGTANSGIFVGTSTGNTIQFQFNGTTSHIFGSGYISVGTNPASAGFIRSPFNSAIVVSRNAANTADIEVVRVDTSAYIAFGQGGNSSGVRIYGVAAIFNDTTANPLFGQLGRQSDAATQSLTVSSQAPFATATGTNRVPGNLILNVPSPTNSGTTRGNLILRNDGYDVLTLSRDTSGIGTATWVNGVKEIYDSTSSINFGSNNSTIGFIRGPGTNSTILVSGRDLNNTTNYQLMAYDTSGANLTLSIGGGSGFSNPATATYIMSSGSVFIAPGGSGTSLFTFGSTGFITFSSTAATPYIQYGSNPATSGFIRSPNNSTILTVRNAANTSDIPIFSVNSSDQILIGGDASAGNTTVSLRTIIYGGSSSTVYITGNSVNNIRVTTNRIDTIPPASDAAPGALTIATGTPFASATGTNRNPANLILSVPSPSNGGTTYGSLILRNGGVDITQGSDGTNTWLQYGTNPASGIGFLRAPNNTVVISARNSTNTNNITIIETDSSDNLILGSITSGVRPASTILDATTSVNLRVGGTSYFSVLAANATTLCPIIAFGEGVSNPTFTQNTRTTDAPVRSITISSQAPYASATGTNRNPGNLTLSVPSPTNSGTTYGSLILQNGGVSITQGSDGTNTWLSYGTNPSSALGFIRAPNNTTVIGARNAANTADISLVSSNASNSVILGDTVNVGAVVIQSTGTQITCNTSGINFSEGTSNALFGNSTRTADNLPNNLVIRAAGAFTSAVTNINGATLRLQGGTASSDGVTGRRGGVRLELSSGGVVMYEAAEPAIGRRASVFNRASAITTTELPSNTGDLVCYLGNAATAPTAAPVSGGLFYSNAGAFSWYGPSATGAFSIGADSNSITFPGNSSTTGLIRAPNATTILTFRNQANNGDINIIATDVSNQLAFGTTSTGSTTFIRSLTLAQFQVGASAHTFGLNSSGQLNISATTSTPIFTQTTQTSDIPTTSLTIQSQLPFATATGSNRTPGNLILSVGSPTNSGTTYGTLRLQNGGVQVNFDTDGTNIWQGMGTNPASTGIFRVPNGQTILAARNSANTGNLNLLSVTSADVLYVGADGSGTNPVTNSALVASSTIFLRPTNSTAAGIVLNSTGVVFDPAHSNPGIAWGTNPATSGSGFLRAPNNTNILSFRNAANSGNLTGISTNSSDEFVIGNLTNTSRVYAGSTIALHSAGSNAASFAWLLDSTGLWTVGLGYSAPGFTQTAKATDVATSPFTITAQAPYSAATGTNRTPGDLILATAAPTNSGTTYGTHRFRSAGTDIMTITRTSVGDGYISLAANTGFNASNIQFDNLVSTPSFTQKTPTTDVATTSLTIQAQSPYSAATGSNRTPGDLVLATGSPTNSGTTQGSVKLKIGGQDVLTASRDATGNSLVNFANAYTDTSATAGTNGAAPSQVVGYIIVQISGVSYKVPYYNL